MVVRVIWDHLVSVRFRVPRQRKNSEYSEYDGASLYPVIYQRMKKVVTIGGGTGSFMLLSGLKKYPIELSAIVSMADDGGSTGVLRDELGVLPPGDVRQCLVALSDSSEMLRKLMSYRFEDGALAGHSFGNLFLSALEKVTGSFSQAVVEAARILSVKGEVIPVTETDTRLCMELCDGTLLDGENAISTSVMVESIGMQRIFLTQPTSANPLAIERLLSADLIIIGPGNHYSSIVPNLLVSGIAEAIVQSRAKVVYNCNLVSKRGQTDTFTLEKYVEIIEDFLGAPRIDYVTYNTRRPAEALLKKYADEAVLTERNQIASTEKPHYRIIRADLLNTTPVAYSSADKIAETRAFIRHDTEKLSKVLMMLLELAEYEHIVRDME